MALYFPYDNREDYPGKITFRSFAPPVPDVSISGFGILAADTIEGFQNKTGDGLTGRLDTKGSIGSNIDVGDRYRYGVKSNKRNYSGQRVTLYLPQALSFSDQADYDSTVQLGALGAVAEDVINRGGSAGAALGQATQNGVSVLSDLVTGNTGASGEAARLVAARIANAVPGDTVGNVAGSTLRVAVNPNKRTLFRSVNIREFAFQFKMIANSEREADEIAKIIKFFRTELYPSVTGGGTDLIGYNFPNLFDIDMKYNNQPVATKIKPVYLRNVATTYNPSSMGWHADGKPSEVDVTLAFVEERTLNKGDIGEGF